MATPLYDINTSSSVTVDGTAPGTYFRPLRYTATFADAVRVGVWWTLVTPLGSYLLDTRVGLDHEELLSPDSTDDMRADLVSAAVLSNAGVARITVGPDVATVGDRVNITFEAETTTGETFALAFSLGAP